MTKPVPDYLEDSALGEWVPDIFEGFSRRTLPLGEDTEGSVMATLVRRDLPAMDAGATDATSHPRPLLYIHGWSDYFFNTALAKHLSNAGYRFYALELRKYGRSLRPWQTPGLIESLSAYDDEIRLALGVLAAENPGSDLPVLMAHSTGALTAALWADRHPGQISALVLNSPWLELQGNAFTRNMATAVIEPITKVAPSNSLANLPQIDTYWRSLSAEADGEWELHPVWRPQHSFRIPRLWLSAVMAGHKTVASGLNIQEPILVLTSDSTQFFPEDAEQARQADTVIDVKVTANRAVRLGNQLTLMKIPRALHDIFASPQPIRGVALDQTVSWLSWVLGSSPVDPSRWSQQ